MPKCPEGGYVKTGRQMLTVPISSLQLEWVVQRVKLTKVYLVIAAIVFICVVVCRKHKFPKISKSHFTFGDLKF